MLLVTGAAAAFAGPFLPAPGGVPSIVQSLGLWLMIWGLGIVLARPVVDGVDAAVARDDESARKMELVLAPPWRKGTIYFITVSILIGCIALPSSAGRGGAIATGVLVALFGGISVLYLSRPQLPWMRRAKRLLQGGGIEATLATGHLSRAVSYSEVRFNRTVSFQDANGYITTRDRESAWAQGRPRGITSQRLVVRLDDGSELVLESPFLVWFAPVQFSDSGSIAMVEPPSRVMVLDLRRQPSTSYKDVDGIIVFGVPSDARAELQSILHRWQWTWGVALVLSVLAAGLPFSF